MKRRLFAAALCSAWALSAADLREGAFYPFAEIPAELIARSPAGAPVTFSLEENMTTGYGWEFDSNTNECSVVADHVGGASSLAGAPGRMKVTVKSLVQTPVRVEFFYRRPWEKNAAPARKMRFLLYTAAGKTSGANYPDGAVLRLLKAECAARGIVITDWHLHIRGGMTPEMAAERERASGIRSGAIENHGREWEINDNARLREFAARVKAVKSDGHRLPAGIQVNDRDWFRQIDPTTRAEFDYILADTMIMGRLPGGRDNRLWLVKKINDPDAWMERYVEHNLRILDEPIDILANPTYLPAPLAGDYDRLWTDERMRRVIKKAVSRGVAIEIQAESPYPRPKFLRMAKAMGAKFSFGTNNFDTRPKDLSRWLEAITWLDLRAGDIWSPGMR
ncbi:MAG: protease inhibitor I42 family protein [Kiritimatiellae bacterium]|nr:protease inhibitor I42 family protein [Kiritimatiellia bacterium]